MTRKRNAAKFGDTIELLTDVLNAGNRRILKKGDKARVVYSSIFSMTVRPEGKKREYVIDRSLNHRKL